MVVVRARPYIRVFVNVRVRVRVAGPAIPGHGMLRGDRILFSFVAAGRIVSFLGRILALDWSRDRVLKRKNSVNQSG